MMNTFSGRAVLLGCALILFAACGRRHFLGQESYREQVHSDFLERRELAAGRDSVLFAVFDGELTDEQREALEFLYAYMPLCDLAEYDGEFFLRQVDGAFRARDYFKWKVPEEIFRHFVLVHRVNNEYMDDARDVFFEELKERIKGMSMREAALEVNHWCHEKVTYRGTDPRTSAPLATMKTSWGRCGEQSTFTVTALRAVGIPARQCYTPRWVHTDSNHAWVEVWIDGRWHYMGACEPEPELDVAWFDGPVQRAMMTHSTVYGRYNGPEEKNIETPLYSVINTLSVYAPVRRAGVQVVQVVDKNGSPVEGATVQFKVYNMGELYPIVTMTSDARGRTAIDTGKGDLMVWVSKGDSYGYAKSAADDTLTVVALSRRAGEEYDETFTMAAPVEQPFNELPAEQIAANAVRLAHEDSIRNSYMSTFATEERAAQMAEELDLPADKMWTWLRTAQGNWSETEAFLLRANTLLKAEAFANSMLKSRDRQATIDNFMSSLRAKDLRDTPEAVLSDFFPDSRSLGQASAMSPYIAQCVISPRIGWEQLTPWNSYLREHFEPRTAEEIIRYVVENVRVSYTDNYYNCSLTPRGVHELRVADPASRDIYFVALCRVSNIPARLDPATMKPQYLAEGQWVNVNFGENSTSPAMNARITFRSSPENMVNPIYGTHFTLARFENGDFRTLELAAMFYRATYPVSVPLDEGYYRILIASRANDGSAKITVRYLNIGTDEASAEIVLPKLEGKIFVKGVVDMNSVIVTQAGEKTTLKKLSRGRGAMVVFADPDKEPTKHILQEMPAYKAALEEWGGAVVYMVPDDKRSDAFDPAAFDGQPAQTVWATDDGRQLLDAAASALQLQFRNNFPLVLYLTNNGGVLFNTEGYRIGIIEEVLRTIKLEQETKTN